MFPVVSLLLFVSMLPFHATVALLSNNRLQVDCTGSTYAVNSTYQAKLNKLLSSLTAESSSSIYSNATIGRSSNRIYGLYLCRGDQSPTDCQMCVQTAAANITAAVSCPSSRQAVIWYDFCMLRYSDANFFGVPDTKGLILINTNTSNTSPMPYQMVSKLVEIAPFRQPMFAFNTSTSTSSYAMAQCTDDLTPAGCSQCLNTILSSINNCCLTSVGWQYLSASCSIRYEVYPFLHNSNGAYTQIAESTYSANNLPPNNKLLTFRRG